MSKPKQSGISVAAPFVCAGLLAALLIVGGISARRPLGTSEYNARVRTAMEAIPYKIGPAVGVDVEPLKYPPLHVESDRGCRRRYRPERRVDIERAAVGRLRRPCRRFELREHLLQLRSDFVRDIERYLGHP